MKAIIICSIAFAFSIQSFSEWVPLVTNTTAGLEDICFVDINTGLSAGSGGVIIRTSNAGTNWTLISSQTAQNIFSLCFPSVYTGYASGLTGFVIKTSNSGSSWFNTSPCGINVRSISFINSLTGITGGGGTLMCYTTNGGNGWNPRYTPTPHMVTGLHYFSSSLLMVCGTDFIGAVLHRSTDSGNNWSTVMTLNNSGLNSIYSLTSVYFKDMSTGFASGSHQLYGQTRGNIYRSTDSGNNWVGVGTTGIAAGNSIYCVHFGDSQNGFAVGNNGVIMRSTNGGANWDMQSSGTAVSLTAVYMQNALTGYICGANGLILKTTNGGVMGLEPKSGEIPEQFELYQNYPNPFNPSTKIRFDIATSNLTLSEAKGFTIQLKVLDILGRELAIIVNEQLRPGTYEVEWDGTNFSSGIYYYKLISIVHNETKRMVLIK